MIAPRGACASVPANTVVARIFTQRRRPLVRHAATASTSVVRTVKKATTRFENSTYEWYPLFGNGSPGWQPGQCWQPSPEPVRRTVAPEPTITSSASVAAKAMRRNPAGEIANDRGRDRARGADSSCMTGSLEGTC